MTEELMLTNDDKSYKYICKHNKNRYMCRECYNEGVKLNAFCEHGKYRKVCKLEPENLCEDHKEFKCKECIDPELLCKHNNIKKRCTTCNMGHCEVCKITIHSLHKHLKTKKHQTNLKNKIRLDAKRELRKN